MSSERRVYLDSSIFIGAAIPGSNHNASTQVFCQQLAAERSSVIFSVIMRYEYAHIAYELGSPASRRFLPQKTVMDYGLNNWNSDPGVRNRWMMTVEENLERLLSQFAYYAEAPIRAEAWPLSLDIMIQNDLRSYDALHVATARYFGIDDFASCDRHFAVIDGLNVMIVRDQ